MTKLRTSAAGFTMIELLVSMVLSLVTVASVYAVYRVQAHTLNVQQNRQIAMDYARGVVDTMVREIRNAGANPLGVSSGANCAGSPTAGLPGVVTATSTSFKLTYDYRGSAAGSLPDGNCDDPDEEVTYQYQIPGPQNCASGTGDITRTANGTTEPLTDCNVTAFSLSYYAQNSSTAMSPVVVTDIQRVQLTVTVQSKHPDGQFGGQLTSTISSNIDLRNRGL
jgi:prepilin-type N-terminal cleavage/methylation domain-containing protein